MTTEQLIEKMRSELYNTHFCKQYFEKYDVARISECPDEYDSSDLELVTDLCLDGISLDKNHECKVTDFEICGINE